MHWNGLFEVLDRMEGHDYLIKLANKQKVLICVSAYDLYVGLCRVIGVFKITVIQLDSIR